MSRKKQETVVDVAATQTPPPTPIQVLRESLVAGLTEVKPAIGRGGLFALSHVLLEAMENQLRLTSTNQDVVIRAVVPILGGGTDWKWKLAVPAQTLDEVVRSLPPETQLLLQPEDGNKLLLVADRTQAHIKGLPAAEFPLTPPFEMATETSLRAGDWSLALRQALTAVAKDDAAPSLTHVHVEAHAGRLIMTGTDSHRLSRSAYQQCLDVENMVWLLPKMLAKLVADASARREGGGPVIFGWNDRQVMFDMGATLILSTCGDMKFPDFRTAVESVYARADTSLVFDRAQLSRALKVVSVMMPDSKQMRLRLGQELLLWSGDDLTGETQQSVPYHKGEVPVSEEEGGLQVSVNGRFLRDAVDASTGELVLLRVSSADKSCAIIVASVEEGAEDYHLIMPMSLER